MKVPYWVILAAIVFGLGLFLRVEGLQFGSPAADARPDENLLIRESVYLLAGDQIRFHRYPPALMYTYAGLFRIASAMGYLNDDALFGYATNPMPYHLIGRWFTSLLGCASVLLVGLTAKKLYGRPAAVVALAGMAFYPLHVLHSHFATVDVPATFFAALTIHFTLTAKKGSLQPLFIAAFFAGIAAAIKYPIGMIAILPLLRVVVDNKSWRSVTFVCLAAAFGLLLAAPTWLTDPQEVWQGLKMESASQSGRRDLMSFTEILSQHGQFALLSGFGLLALAASTLGFVTGVKRQNSLRFLFVFALMLFLFNIFLGVPFARYFVPLAPIIALSTASLCLALGKKWQPKIVIVLLLMQVPNLVASYHSSQMLKVQDTRSTLLEAFADGTLPIDIPVIRPSWPFDPFPIATNAAFSMVPKTTEASEDGREALTRSLAAKLRASKDLLRVFEFGESQRDQVDLAQILGDSDMLYIEPETPTFGDESLTFPFQRKTVGPNVRESAKNGMVSMTLLLDLDPRKDGEFPAGDLYERFEYWFIPLGHPRAVLAPGPRIRVYRISAIK